MYYTKKEGLGNIKQFLDIVDTGGRNKNNLI